MKKTTLSSAVAVLGIAAIVIVYRRFADQQRQNTTISKPSRETTAMASTPTPSSDSSTGLALATFGNGCFWCTEAIFQQLKGVTKVTSGYSGGSVVNPTYQQVCDGTTGHAEVIQIEYDPKVITYAELLEVFWKTHDPTTLNRQGNDIGTQYRSAVFFHTEEQKKLAEEYKSKLDQSGAFNKPIVTEVTAYSTFYPAANYHQNYLNLHGENPYCSYVIVPKLEKFKQVFANKLK